MNSTYEGSFQVSLEEIGITSNGELKLEFEEGIYKGGVGTERFNINCFEEIDYFTIEGDTVTFHGVAEELPEEIIWDIMRETNYETVTTIIMEKGIKTIDIDLSYFQNLKKIVLPDGLIKINSYTFSGCVTLEEITIPDSVTTIEMEVFSETVLKEVVLPSSITSLGFRVFGYKPKDVKFIYTPGSYVETYLRDYGYIN